MSAPLHVEIVQKRSSRASKDFIKETVHCHLANFASITPGATLSRELEDAGSLKEHVQSISFCDAEHESEVAPSDCEFVYHVFRLDTFGAETDTLTDAASGEELAAATVWALPNEEFHGLWESLVYDTRLKADTLRFAEAAFSFAERGVDPNVVGVNRVVLLHGPTGTGKTSLCRALAQKLAVRLSERFPRARLLEIDAHSLFSKWFSESGKLVARLFARVAELAEDPRLLAVVLVDEVESLAAARQAALRGLEPSDAVRAVNAVLTALDRLRRLPNALLLATSNVTGAIDVAFVDRADVKRLVGPPSARAAYAVLRSCCAELATRGVLAGCTAPLPLRELESVRFRETEGTAQSLRLWRVAREAAAEQLSGRALRRLPFLACALHVAPRTRPTLPQFLDALHTALLQHAADAAAMRDADDPDHALNNCSVRNGTCD
ncbi:pachytene checkpoint protein 2 homolog [Maniola jurtina]|uniref:pachytene checkpoint protein 2 homolog n=1 Tax=Maniola jurtina TaxID=191418 RepID=UPI001E68E6DC|nr:pachytene checkpoint protein 2 homolog [Maniola jurtina]